MIGYNIYEKEKLLLSECSVPSDKKQVRAECKLKAKKKYYVRVRTYKIVDGTKIYSDWSSSKNIKTK